MKDILGRVKRATSDSLYMQKWFGRHFLCKYGTIGL